MTTEKRHFARIHWLIPCRFQQGATHGWGMIRNISIGGAQLATRFPVEQGSDIFLTFRVGDKNVFEKLRATVLTENVNGQYRFCNLDFGEKVDHLVLEKAMNSLLAEQLEEI